MVPGLKLITPSSVTGGSLSGAKISYTAATSVTVNGVFDSTYDHYLLVGSSVLVTGSERLYVQLASGGSTDTATNYRWQRLRVIDNAFTGSSASSQDDMRVVNTNTGPLVGYQCYVWGPALAQSTAMRVTGTSYSSGAQIFEYAGAHSTASAYDGFTLTTQSVTTHTGSLLVYGFNQ